MGFFDGPGTANLLLHDWAGRTLIRPWGKWGKTYLVTAEAEERLRRMSRRFYTGMLVVIVAMAAVARPLVLIALAPAASAIYCFLLWRLTRELEPVDAVPVESREELIQRHVRSVGVSRLWWMLAGAVGFVAAGVWMALEGDITGWFVAVFFGLCGVSSIWQLRVARKMGKEPPGG
jgi:hypothetical protein